MEESYFVGASFSTEDFVSDALVAERYWNMPVSNNERWYCECCSDRKVGSVSHLLSAGEDIAYLWVCDNCAHLAGEVQLAAAYYLEKYGTPLYEVFTWVAERTPDATISLPYTNARIAVSVGPVSDDGSPRCECCLEPAVGDLRDLKCCGTSVGRVSLCKRCARLFTKWHSPETIVAAAFVAQRTGRPAPWLHDRIAHGIKRSGFIHD